MLHAPVGSAPSTTAAGLSDIFVLFVCWFVTATASFVVLTLIQAPAAGAPPPTAFSSMGVCYKGARDIEELQTKGASNLLEAMGAAAQPQAPAMRHKCVGSSSADFM